MLVEFAKVILLLTAVFLLLCGILMLLDPKTARNCIRMAGSTTFINYAEISLRLVPAAGFILFSPESPNPKLFSLIGWFFVFSAGILFFVPPKMHHAFSNRAADVLSPLFLQILSPFSFLAAGMILFSIQS